MMKRRVRPVIKNTLWRKASDSLNCFWNNKAVASTAFIRYEKADNYTTPLQYCQSTPAANSAMKGLADKISKSGSTRSVSSFIFLNSSEDENT